MSIMHAFCSRWHTNRPLAAAAIAAAAVWPIMFGDPAAGLFTGRFADAYSIAQDRTHSDARSSVNQEAKWRTPDNKRAHHSRIF
jgi:hypothetical protein